MAESVARRTFRPITIALISSSIMLVLSSAWALASPLGSLPDEPSHMVRAAAAALGDLDPDPSQLDPAVDAVEVPGYVAAVVQRTCFAADVELDAGCADDVEIPVENAIAVTSAGMNLPIYYAIVGQPVKVFGSDAGLYAMRLTNAFWCAVLWGIGTWFVALRGRPRWALVTSSLAVTPMVLFLAGGVNPNGVEVAGAFALLASALVVLDQGQTRGRRGLAAAAVGVSVASMASARPVALLWSAIILFGAAVFLGLPQSLRTLRDRAVVLAATAVTAVVVSVLWWQVSASTGSGGEVPHPISPVAGFLTVAINGAEYAKGYVGVFGWLDTQAPSFTYAVYCVVLLGALAFGLRNLRGGPRAALAILVASLAVLPPLLQAALAPSAGLMWQGRYLLPLLVVALTLVGMGLDRQASAGSNPDLFYVRGAIVAIAMAQIFAFTWTLRRYVSGMGNPILEFLVEPQWQAPLGNLALIVLYSGAVSAASVALWKSAR